MGSVVAPLAFPRQTDVFTHLNTNKEINSNYYMAVYLYVLSRGLTQDKAARLIREMFAISYLDWRFVKMGRKLIQEAHQGFGLILYKDKYWYPCRVDGYTKTVLSIPDDRMKYLLTLRPVEQSIIDGDVNVLRFKGNIPKDGQYLLNDKIMTGGISSETTGRTCWPGDVETFEGEVTGLPYLTFMPLNSGGESVACYPLEESPVVQFLGLQPPAVQSLEVTPPAVQPFAVQPAVKPPAVQSPAPQPSGSQ